MKSKPVRISDVSRVIRISSSSLITFLQDNGYSVKGDYRSPMTGRMVELVQNGYREGPPFDELTPYILRAENWEELHTDVVTQLHTPSPEIKSSEKIEFSEDPTKSVSQNLHCE